MDIFFRTITVNRTHLDFNGHVNNLEYLKWMQDAAIMHSTGLGWSPTRYVKTGYSWFIGSHSIQYLRPAHEEDSLGIVTWVSEMKSRTLKRRYWCVNKSTGKIHAKAETLWVFVRGDTGKPCRIIDELLQDYKVVTNTEEVRAYLTGIIAK